MVDGGAGGDGAVGSAAGAGRCGGGGWAWQGSGGWGRAAETAYPKQKLHSNSHLIMSNII